MAGYLIVNSQATQYAVVMENVRAVFLLPQLSAAPEGTPDYVIGLLNFHGEAAPVFDLAKRFNHDANEYTINDVVLLLESEEKSAAMLVQAVGDVIEIPASAILPPLTSAHQPTAAQKVAGEIKIGDEVLMLLNIKVLMDFEDVQSTSSHTVSERFKVKHFSEDDAQLLRDRAHHLAELEAKQDASAGKFALTRISDQLIALDITKVRTFTKFNAVQPIPGCPDYVLGCINLHGEILAVLNTNRLLNLKESKNPTSIVVVEIGDQKIGLAVDEIINLISATSTEFSSLDADFGEASRFCTKLLHHENKTAGLINLELLIQEHQLAVNESV